MRSPGGVRKGVGRPPNGPKPGVSHLRRPRVRPHDGVHVTVRLRGGRPSLRTLQAGAVLRTCFQKGRDRFGFRLVQFAVMGNHLHLVAEADDARSLARGMQGLCVRFARRLNRLHGRHGKVFADRYFAHVLTNPTAARKTLVYVMQNARKHGLLANLDEAMYRRGAPPVADPYTSAAYFDGWSIAPRFLGPRREGAPPVTAPLGWLLTQGWRRADPGPIHPSELPAGA